MRHHNGGIFLCSWPRCHQQRRGVHIPGVWLPSPRPGRDLGAVSVRCGRAPAENRPGSGTAASGTGERQALKLMGYTSHVGGLRPRMGRPFTAEPARGRNLVPGSADLVTVPAPGRQAQGRARFKGPPMLPSPHQPTSGKTDTLTENSPKNRTESRKKARKTPGNTWFILNQSKTDTYNRHFEGPPAPEQTAEPGARSARAQPDARLRLAEVPCGKTCGKVLDPRTRRYYNVRRRWTH